MKSEPLSKVAPARSSDRHVSADTVVWHLNLDQIVSGNGRHRMSATMTLVGRLLLFQILHKKIMRNESSSFHEPLRLF
jgi:hypothetical protein